MSQRKESIQSMRNYAAVLTKLNTGKKRIHISQVMETLKLQRKFEASAIIAGRKSALLVIRRAAVLEAKKKIKKMRRKKK